MPAIAAGRRGAARRVPGGISRSNAASASAAPPIARGEPMSTEPAPSPPSDSAVPAASQIARGTRLSPRIGVSGRPRARSPGTVSAVATARIGSRPRKTRRHDAYSATAPASAGPTMPGTTHTVDSTANMRGRNDSW